MDRLEELRALYQEGKLWEARELYEREPGHTDPEWYWLGSLVYWHLQEYPLSRWAADYGLSLGPVGELRLKLLYRLGTTEEQLGAYGEAIDHLEACVAELPAYPALAAIMQGAVLHNLALAYYNRNGNADSVLPAIHYYERAAVEFRRETMPEHLRSCLHNLAWALCDTGQAERAATVLDEAAPLCQTEDSLRYQRVANAYQLLVAGDRVRCLAILEPLVSTNTGGSAFIFALCVFALACLDLQGNDPRVLDQADDMAHLAAMTACTGKVDPRCWTTANRVQKRVLAALKQQSRGA